MTDVLSTIRPQPVVVVRGVGEIGSAVAHAAFRSGRAVVIHEPSVPLTARRHMSFADAIFDGVARLEGVCARRVTGFADLAPLFEAHRDISIVAGALKPLLDYLRPQVLIDARMRKRDTPENQRDLAPFTIGLGPSYVAGATVDAIIETSWDQLGKIIRHGPSLPLTGEPRMLGGYGRERFVYAPVAGLFHTEFDIGAPVTRGQPVAAIGTARLHAPLTGILRGITRSGVEVPSGTKVIEVDPRGDASAARGIFERPRRIADAVLLILDELPVVDRHDPLRQALFR